MLPYVEDLNFKFEFDYDEHPLFKDYKNPNEKSTRNLEGLIEKLDSEIQKFWKFAPGTAERLDQSVKASELLQQTKNEILGFAAPESELHRLLATAFDKTWKSIIEEVGWRTEHNTKKSFSFDKNESRFRAYERDGFAAWHFSKKDIDQLKSLAKPLEEELRTKMLKDSRVLCNMSVSFSHPLVTFLKELLKREHIYELVESIQGGRPMALNYVSISFAHPKETWWNCYSDDGMSPTKTAYMHYDEDPANQKMLIYLSEVKPENGPFHFVKGSHRWKRSPFLFAWSRMLDRELMNMSYEERKKGPIGAYQRPMALPQYRKLFMEIPPLLRRLGQFGDDILDQSELSNQLRSREVQVTSEVGNVFIFAGDQGIHRGGLVQSGERWSLQLGFCNATSRSFSSEIKHFIAQGIKNLLGERVFNWVRARVRNS